MFNRIETADPRIVAFDAIGTITDDDYRSTLIPALDKAAARHGKVRAALRFGGRFEGYTARAVMDDALYGLSHVRAFERVAVVSDIEWIRRGVAMFAHLSVVPVRIFAAHQTQEAIAWLARDDPAPG